MPQKEDLGQSTWEADGNKLAKAVKYIYTDMERAVDVDGCVESLRIRGPRYEGDEYMLVAKRTSGDGKPEVAFQISASLHDCLLGFGNRLRNGSVKWVPDKYASS